MKILMTGATGFIGSSLGQRLTGLGHSIVVVTRNIEKARGHHNFKAEFIEWDLNTEPLAPEYFKNIEALVNLAGESVDGRWTKKKKNKILNSRLLSARNLLLNCPISVRTIVTASAQGIYGDRGEEVLTEESVLGSGFLAEVCKLWEAAFSERPQQRVVILRFGMVLSRKGGALRKLISLFQKNLGAVLGSGQQWISFISLNDLVNVMIAALTRDEFQGVFNVANNNPVTNREFTKALCKSLQVIRLPDVPGFFLRLALGEMSQLVLSSIKMKPEKLNQLGFEFKDNDLEKIFRSD